jgi:hypothetical protein
MAEAEEGGELIMTRHLNRNLQRAIDEGWLIWWEYGVYFQHYTGFVLHGHNKSKNGACHNRVLFATGSLNGATEIREILNERGFVNSGWENAVRQHKGNTG